MSNTLPPRALFLARIEEVARLAALRLADIAKIPSEHHGAFCEHMTWVIADTQCQIISRVTTLDYGGGGVTVFEEVEEAVVNLQRAVAKLTRAQEDYLQEVIQATAKQLCSQGFPPPEQLPPPLLAALPILMIACSKCVGKNPFRGSQKGGIRDYEFQHLVYGAWVCAKKYGGELKAGKRNTEYYGEMFEAIDVLRRHIVSGPLRPIFRHGQEQTVVNIVADAKKGIHPGINPRLPPKHLQK
jgi:hypothetical protein